MSGRDVEESVTKQGQEARLRARTDPGPDAFDTFEASGWQAGAADYDRHWSVLTSRLADPLLDAAAVGATSRVLDVACGPGYLAGRAAERGAVATGVDIAEAMVRRAQRHHPRARFRQGDAQALPFPDAAFDAVVASLGLPHFGRPECAVAEFRRVLVAGGRVALASWDLASPAELWEALLNGTVRTSALISGQSEAITARIRGAFERGLEAHQVGPSYEVPASFVLGSGRAVRPRGENRKESET